MLSEELVNAGWNPENCRIGTLYFKEDFFCRIKDNGIVAVFRCNDDMNPIGYAGTLDDINSLMQKSDLAEITKAEILLDIMKSRYEKKYGIKFIK